MAALMLAGLAGVLLGAVGTVLGLWRAASSGPAAAHGPADPNTVEAEGDGAWR